MWPDLLIRSKGVTLAVRFGLLPVVLIFYGTAAIHFDYTPDDTYIYLQYARNLASGNGFAFNAGEPSYGTTGPLWVFLIAAGAAGGLDPFVVAKTLDLIFASLSLIVFLRVAVSVLRDPIFALAATAILALDAWLLRWAGTGMETSLAVLLTLLCFQYVLRGEYGIASVAAALLSLTRPEGFVLFLLILVDNFVNSRAWKMALRSAWTSVAVFLALTVPWVVYAWLTFDRLLPTTVGAKSITGYSLSTTLFVIRSEAAILLPTQGICMVFAIIGVVGVIRRAKIRMAWIEAFPVAWVAAVLLLYVVLNVQVVSRYLLIISPILTLFGVWGVKKTWEFWKLPWKPLLMLLAGVVIVTSAQSQTLYYWKVVPHMREFMEGMNQCLRPMAYHLRGLGSDGDVVLTPDIGMVGYISGKRVFDTAGIITPAVKRTFEGTDYHDGMKKAVYESVIRPKFVIDRSSVAHRLSTPQLQSVFSCGFQSMGIGTEGPVSYTLYQRRHSE